MPATICQRAVSLLLSAWVSLGAIDAGACSATVPDVFSVGNKATDASCNYGSIQVAIDAATCAAGTKIILNQSGDYTNQHLTITDKNITLVGRASAPHCNTLEAACGVPPLFLTCPVGPLQTIDGSRAQHPGGGPVLQVRGTSNVTISHVVLTGGDGVDGGGIDFSSPGGSLSLDNSTIIDNHANNGAGINLHSASERVTLDIGPNTAIEDNTAAADGGGIRVDGIVAVLDMNAAGTWITGNRAAGYGGGIEVVDGTADIGSGGYLGAVIYNNVAKYGGGIATHSVTHGPDLNLYTTDPLHPVTIDGNTAYESGGGIYNEGVMCAADFRLTSNIAKDGSGLYMRGEASFNTTSANSCLNLPSLGSVPCDPSQQCSIIHGNLAEDAKQGYADTDGAALRIFGTLYGNDLDVRANHGGYVLHLNGDADFPQYPNVVELSNSVFAENDLTHELMLAYLGTSQLRLTNCTLVNDTIGTDHVLSSNDVLSLDDSIIAEGSLFVSQFGVSGEHNLAENASGLSGTSSAGRPTFIDEAHGDYRLFYGIRGGHLLSSPGIDSAPANTTIYDDRWGLDIRDAPRDQQVSAGSFGPRDLGAYEMQGVTDRIFIDTFGDDQLLVQ